MRIKKLFPILVATVVFGGAVFSPQTANAAFVAGNVVDDTHFENSTSMSAAQIDAFLNGFSASCLSSNNGFRTPDPQGWSNSQNQYLYGANVTAGQAIYDVAQLYHVNPQVILSTLQKEQSLPTGSAGCYPNEPDPATATPMTDKCGPGTRNCTLACTHSGGCMNIALGYGCPSYCEARNEGFSKQLTLGIWLLRFGQQRAYGNLTGYPGYETSDEYFCYTGPMVAGTRQRSASTNKCVGLVPGNSAITYDGSYTTLDGTSINVSNGATASLYNFTPFISGNQSFVNIYENTFGFGPTHGDLARTPNGGVYKIEGNQKRAFPSELIFLSYSYKWSDVSIFTSLDQFSPGADIPYNAHYRDGILVTYPSGGMFVVDNGTKRPFPNAEAFLSYSYKWSDALVISSAEINLIPGGVAMPYNTHYRDGRLVSSQSNGIYVVANGQRRPFSDEISFLSYGYKWSDPLVISNYEVSQIPDGVAMPYNVHYRDGKLVKSSGGVYKVENGQKRAFPSEAVFLSYSYKWSDVVTVSSYELSLIPDGPVMTQKN